MTWSSVYIPSMGYCGNGRPDMQGIPILVGPFPESVSSAGTGWTVVVYRKYPKVLVPCFMLGVFADLGLVG